MGSKNHRSIAAEQFACLSTRVLELAVQTGTRAAMDYLQEEKKARQKGRHDRRLRNTRLLLQNYRSFKGHAKGAVSSAKQANESAIDILEGLDDFSFDKDLYIDSISRTKQRTMIILNHIDEMLQYYRIACEESGKPEEMRRYRVIVGTYINDQRKTAAQIAEEEHIERRTLYKDISAAIRPLSALIFGIDGLKMY